MYKHFLRKVFTVVSLLSILVQPALPVLALSPNTAYAQQAQITPTETVSPTLEPTDSAVSPQTEVTPVPTDAPTPTDVSTPTDLEATPTAEPTGDSTITPSENQENKNNASSNSGSTPTVTEVPTAVPTQDQVKDENGDLSVVVLENASAPSIDLGSYDSQGSAALTTDKLDYAPTDTALITGTGLLPKSMYTLYVSSTDPPAVNFSTEVTTDDQGTFAYAYQLDGTYRPNYKVELKDADGNVVASTSFTDTDTTAHSGTTFAGNITISSGDVDWSNANNVAASDDSRATVTIGSSSDITNYLRATGFGFAIPVGATINGIVAKIERSEANTQQATIRDNVVSLVKNNVVSGSNKASASDWPTLDATATYGTNADLWGTTWTPADINNVNFGLVLSAKRTSGGDETARVDHITVTVTYTESTPVAEIVWPNWTTPSQCSTDPSDESPSEVDLLGDSGNPAVGFGSDANYMYFRERIEGDPGAVTNLHQYSWVVLFQSSTPQYQYLGTVSGKAGNKVQLWNNPTNSPSATGVDFSPLFNDPADSVVWEGSSATYARVTSSGGVYFIDWAIPLTELTSRGININTTKFFATSTNANNYNKDHLNCYEAVADLSVVKSDSPDPVTSGGTLTYTLAVHNGGSDTATGVVVTDTLPAGYSVTSVTPSQGSCSDMSAPSIQCELGTMTNGANATVTIVGTIVGQGTVTNNASVSSTTLDTNTANNNDSEDTTINPATGSVKVNKLVDRDGNGTFEDSNPQDFTWSLDTVGTNAMGGTVSGVSTGSHNVNENNVTDYHFVGWYPTGDTSGKSCSNPTGAQLPVSATVSANTTTDITLCNAVDIGTVVVHKDVQGPNGESVTDTSNTFKVKIDGTNEQNITDNGTVTYNNVIVGNHTVTESVISSDYSLYGISETQGASGSTGGLSVSVASGQTTHVYVTNRQKKASITVKKIVEDSSGKVISDDQTFTVQLNQANDDSTLSDVNDVIYNVNPGGPFTVSEVNNANYDNLGCKLVTGADATNFNLTSNQSETVTCTNQQKPGTISGYKFKADGSTGIAGWTVNLLLCASDFTGCVLGATTTTSGSGFYSFNNLVTGFYQVAEFLDSLFTPVGATTHNVTITPNADITDQNFSNFKNSEITVCKKSDTDGDLNTTNDQSLVEGWDMTLKVDGIAKGSAQTEKDGCYTFANLGPNHSYSVTEETRDGWTALNDTTHNFGSPEDGINQEYTFINYGYGSITVHKMVDTTGNGTYTNGDDGGFTWTLDLSGAKVMGDTDSNVTVGQHSVDENLVTDYHFVGWYPTGALNNDEVPYSCTNLFNTSHPISVNVGAGGTSDFTLCNARDTGTIEVIKEIESVNEDSGLFDLNIDSNTEKSDASDGDSTGKVTVLTGTHSVGEVAGTETSLDDYVSSISCVDGGGDGEVVASTDGNGTSLTDINVATDDDIVCTVTNTRKGKVIVTKYNDLNGDGKLDEGEDVLSGWDINLGGQTDTTGVDGKVIFDNLIPDSYSLSEKLKDGWEQTNIFCDQRSFVEGEVRVDPGQTIDCSILNHSLTPILKISKTNNKIGIDQAPGDNVVYTLTLTNDQSQANSVTVKDLLPAGFKYRAGSWNAKLNGVPISISEPVYASPGTWQVGSMNPGDVVELSYIADIDGGQHPGLYRDVAWAKGTSLASATVLALAVDPGDIDSDDSNFVGTEINVVNEQQSGTSITINKKVGEVLGASTSLPATGANNVWVILASIMLTLGLSLTTVGYIIRKRYV